MHRVFSRASYIALAASTSILVFCAIMWARAVPLLVRVVVDVDIPFGKAKELAHQLLIGAFVDATIGFILYSAATALLIGINVAMLSFYVRMYRSAPSSAAAASGFLGGAAALLGFGCAACGSVFLVSFIASLGGAGLIALLPYGGEELGYLGIVLLGISTLMLSRAINKPAVCPI